MALSKAQKTEQLTELKDKMSKAQSIMFAHYIGLSVGKSSSFREELRKGKAEMKVAKKTLMQIAAKDLNLPEISDQTLEGPVACIFSYEDPLSGAQIAFKFGKNNPQVELIGGVFEGKVLSKDEAVAIAKIPGKQQLLGMFAAMINSPLVSFAIALKEIAKQKEQPASPAPQEQPSAVAESPAAAAAPAAATEEKKEEVPAAAAEAAPTPATTEGSAPAPAADAPPAA